MADDQHADSPSTAPAEPAEPTAPAPAAAGPAVSADPDSGPSVAADAEPPEPAVGGPESGAGPAPAEADPGEADPPRPAGSGTEPGPGAADSPAPAGSETELAEPGSDAPGSPAPAGSEPGAESGPTGTTPAWWSWVARHRKPVALVAGLVVVAVVATVVTISVTAAGPKDVVESYMDAIHSGDVDAALEIAGEPKDDGRLEFLSADALAGDWSFGAIVERHRRDDEADVDVTITAGDTTQQGRFHVVKGDDGWEIEAPFVAVDLQVAGVGTVELGAVEQAVGATQPGSTIQLRVFPGAYDLYPSLAKQVTFEPGVLIAAPAPSPDQTLRLTAEYTLTGEGAAFANGAIAERVEECETATSISPDGCPFSGEDERALFSFSSVKDVSWQVTRMPDARFVADVGGLRMVLRKPGLATLSGSGFPYDSDSDEAQPFSVTCEFGVDNLAVAVTKDGLAVDGAVGRPYAAAQNTFCF